MFISEKSPGARDGKYKKQYAVFQGYSEIWGGENIGGAIFSKMKYSNIHPNLDAGSASFGGTRDARGMDRFQEQVNFEFGIPLSPRETQTMSLGNI